MLCLNQEQSFTFYIVVVFLLFCFTICTLIRWIRHSVQRFYANFRQVDFLWVGWKITHVVIEKLCGLGLFCQKTLLLRHKLFLFVSICVDIEIKFSSVRSVNQPFNQSHVHIVRMLCIPPLSRQQWGIKQLLLVRWKPNIVPQLQFPLVAIVGITC